MINTCHVDDDGVFFLIPKFFTKKNSIKQMSWWQIQCLCLFDRFCLDQKSTICKVLMLPTFTIRHTQQYICMEAYSRTHKFCSKAYLMTKRYIYVYIYIHIYYFYMLFSSTLKSVLLFTFVVLSNSKDFNKISTMSLDFRRLSYSFLQCSWN